MAERRKYEMPTQPRDTSAKIGRERAAQRNPDHQAQDKAIEEEVLRQSNGTIPQPNMPLEREPGRILVNTQSADALVKQMLELLKQDQQ